MRSPLNKLIILRLNFEYASASGELELYFAQYLKLCPSKLTYSELGRFSVCEPVNLEPVPALYPPLA